MTGRFVTTDEATGFLRERYPELDPRSVEVLGEGYWSRAFAFQLDGRGLVARFGRHGEDFAKDRAAMAFGSPDAPVPEVLDVGEALGGAYAISERRDGEFLERLDEERLRLVLPALLRAFDHFREVPIAATSPVGWEPDFDADPGPSWNEWLLESLEDVPGGRVSGWREVLAASADLDGLFRRAEAELSRLAPACPDIRHVLHCDLINRNVLVARDGSRLEAVFDWGCSIFGDFVYEVAGLTFWAPWYPALDAVDMARAAAHHYDRIGIDVADFDLRLRCYELHIGLIHLAYTTFAELWEDRAWVAARTRGILQAG